MRGFAFETYRPTAGSLFLLGWDTARIAEHQHISEAEALRRVNEERSFRAGLQSPYEPRRRAA